jgi:tRNA dimethylallyltransferase
VDTAAPITVINIFGPTAVGKTRVAAQVALALSGEIVSADSMQVYQGLPIITDQPPAELLASVPHHLIGTVPLTEDYSAGRFARDAARAIEEISQRGNLPLLVGGTGLYIRALLGGFSFAGEGDAELRRKWETYLKEKGAEAAASELARLDPWAAEIIDTTNPRRLVRALEAAEAGRPVTAERDRLWTPDSRYRVLSFGLALPRDDLYQLIEQRVAVMLAAGAVAEVKAAGCDTVSRTVSQAIGFKDICRHLAGELSLEGTAAAIRQKSRRYAKRQLTWMRKMPDIVRIDMAGTTHSQASQLIIERVRSALAG